MSTTTTHVPASELATLAAPPQARRGRVSSRVGTVVATTAMALLVALGAPTAAATDEADVSPVVDYAVLVRGELFSDDLEEAQAMHDTVAAGGEEAARAAGDIYHLAAVSTSVLGGSEGAFLGVDRWSSPEGIEAFYADPAIAEAFGMLFASEPQIGVFERQLEWHSWGDMPDPAVTDERWVAVVRGRLAESDPEAARQAHDAVASAGQATAEAAGDIAHVVYTGLADATEFLAFDVWDSDQGIEAVYGDAAFQAAFATQFSEPPTLQVYRLTDWYQWS